MADRPLASSLPRRRSPDAAPTGPEPDSTDPRVLRRVADALGHHTPAEPPEGPGPEATSPPDRR